MFNQDNKNRGRGGNKRRFGRREAPEFEQKLIDLARVTRVVKGGRRFSFRASVVIGNRKGKVAFGVAKGSDVAIAIGKAFSNAKKDIIVVKRNNTSIDFTVYEKFGAARVMIKPAKEGRGIVAGGAMRTVLELAGIKDVVAKSFGSANKINVARATIKALKELNRPMVTRKRVESRKLSSDKVEKKEKKS